MDIPIMLETAIEPPAAQPAGARRFAAFAWFVLAYNVAVVVWGAYVRATGSGAGCGNHWPLCNGQITPHSPAIATIIEFTHRVSSGLDLLLVAGMAVWAFRGFPRRHPVRLGAVLSGIFLITEALLGASLVLLHHVAQDTSASRGWSLSTHLMNTLTLIACLTLTAWWAGGKPFIPLRVRGGAAALVSLAAVAVLGVSGAITALGDTLYPVKSLAAGFAEDFDPSASIFVRLRVWHPMIAALVGAWLLYYTVTAFGMKPPVRRLAQALLAVVAIQLAAGAANLLLLAPVWMQLVHLFLADLLWVVLVLLCAERLIAAAPSNARAMSSR
jgi:heme A synthase